jgi:hypothetical protein
MSEEPEAIVVNARVSNLKLLDRNPWVSFTEFPNDQLDIAIGHWGLVIDWDLGLGIWSFPNPPSP